MSRSEGIHEPSDRSPTAYSPLPPVFVPTIYLDYGTVAADDTGCVYLPAGSCDTAGRS